MRRGPKFLHEATNRFPSPRVHACLLSTFPLRTSYIPVLEGWLSITARPTEAAARCRTHTRFCLSLAVLLPSVSETFCGARFGSGEHRVFSALEAWPLPNPRPLGLNGNTEEASSESAGVGNS